METIKIEKPFPCFVRKYRDKNGIVITPDCMISIDGDKPERVFVLEGCEDYCELGVNASNLEYLERHPDYPQEFYPLHNFSKSDIEIIEEA